MTRPWAVVSLCILLLLVLYTYFITSKEFSNFDVQHYWLNVHSDIGKSDVLSKGDSRLMPALALNHILNLLKLGDATVPFTWRDWLDDETLPKDAHLVCPTDFCHIVHAIDENFSPELRAYIGRNYLKNAETPRSVLFLGIVRCKALQVDLSHGSLVQDYKQSFIELKTQIEGVADHWEALEAMSAIRILHTQNDLKRVTYSDFEPSLNQANETPKVSNQTQKYFHEAQLLGSSVGSHFDWRFFQKADFSELEHKTVLHRLARAWLRFAKVVGLKTWLAHGSLLGWYWNGMAMPWDEDMDVHITIESMHTLAGFNQTIVVDCTDDSNVAGAHRYLVDVSPYFSNRDYRTSQNAIDARFIDTENGMYVDITALSRTTAEFVLNSTRSAVALHALLDPEYRHVTKSALLEEYHEKLREAELRSCAEGHLVNCKSRHVYDLSELDPLLETHFEGVQAYVPSSFKIVLEREYPRGLRLKYFDNWNFRPYLLLWVRDTICASDFYGHECQDDEVLLESRFTKGIRLSREKWFDAVQDQPRVDPYIVRHNKVLHKL